MQVESIMKKAKEAILKVFGDTSVTQDVTIDRLAELRDEIELLMETIEQDPA